MQTSAGNFGRAASTFRATKLARGEGNRIASTPTWYLRGRLCTHEFLVLQQREDRPSRFAGFTVSELRRCDVASSRVPQLGANYEGGVGVGMPPKPPLSLGQSRRIDRPAHAGVVMAEIGTALVHARAIGQYKGAWECSWPVLRVLALGPPSIFLYLVVDSALL